MWDKLFASSDLLQKGLKASWTRNAVIRNNLANEETPGFKSSEVEFESIISAALYGTDIVGKRTNARHIEIGGVSDLKNISERVVQNDNTSMRMDGNNVDVEAEEVKLAQNSIQYNTLLLKLNSELARIRLAVTEGR